MAFRKLARATFAIATLAVVVVSLLPIEELPSLDVWDKLEHAVAYALLALLGAVAWAGRARASAMIAVSLVGLGIVLEFLQAFVPGRTTDPADALANLVGTVAGLGLVAGLGRIAGRTSRLGQPGR